MAGTLFPTKPHLLIKNPDFCLTHQVKRENQVTDIHSGRA